MNRRFSKFVSARMAVIAAVAVVAVVAGVAIGPLAGAPALAGMKAAAEATFSTRPPPWLCICATARFIRIVAATTLTITEETSRDPSLSVKGPL